MSSLEVIKILNADGWYKVKQKGSHVHFRHPPKLGKVTVPHPYKDLAPGTLKNIWI